MTKSYFLILKRNCCFPYSSVGMCMGSGGAEFIAGNLDKGLHTSSLIYKEGCWGDVNEPGTGNVPEAWDYFKQKAVVQTFTASANSLRATKGLLVEAYSLLEPAQCLVLSTVMRGW
jgi:hypothetical protein